MLRSQIEGWINLSDYHGVRISISTCSWPRHFIGFLKSRAFVDRLSLALSALPTIRGRPRAKTVMCDHSDLEDAAGMRAVVNDLPGGRGNDMSANAWRRRQSSHALLWTRRQPRKKPVRIHTASEGRMKTRLSIEDLPPKWHAREIAVPSTHRILANYDHQQQAPGRSLLVWDDLDSRTHPSRLLRTTKCGATSVAPIGRGKRLSALQP